MVSSSHWPMSVMQLGPPCGDSPLGLKLKLLETWQLQVLRLQHGCPKLFKEGFTVRGMDPVQVGF